jgi:hypothetical protein
MSSFEYDISNFLSGLNIDQLSNELSIMSKFLYINGSSTTISLFFSDILSDGETTQMQTLLVSHAPDPYLSIQNYPDTSISGSPDTSTSNSEYTSVKVFVYSGKAKTGYPGEIHLIATVDASTTSGSVRLYDLTNRKVVAEMTDITDTTPVILSMPFTKANLPVEKSEFSIQLKCSSSISSTSKKITFHSMLMDYSP